MRLKRVKSDKYVAGIKEVPYPTQGPGFYGKEYLKKFNEFMVGTISANEIIQIKNVLLTKKALEPKKDKMKKLKSLLSHSFIRSPSQIPMLRRPTDKFVFSPTPVNEDDNVELESFVKFYNNQVYHDQRTDRSPRRSYANLQKEQDSSPKVIMQKFQKIRNVIDQRVQNKKILNQDQGQKNFKILQNFQFIAEDYIEKIKNNDLISSDTSKKFYEPPGTIKRCRLKQLQLITSSRSNQQPISEPEDIPPYSKQQFKETSDQYILSYVKEELSSPIPVSSNRSSLRLKAREQILDRDFDSRLQRFLSMRDQHEKQILQEDKKNKFMNELNQLNEIDSVKERSVRGTSVKESHHSKQPSLKSNKVPLKQSDEIYSNDVSLISENEANLDILYSQSRFFQSKVLQRDEKLNRLMRHFVKIEDIKNRAIRTNLRKLGSPQGKDLQ